MNDLYSKLISPSVVLGSGFMIGFTHALKFNKETLDHPLSSLFTASIEGCLTYWGASIVCDLIPTEVRIAIPVLATASCIYYKYNDIMH